MIILQDSQRTNYMFFCIGIIPFSICFGILQKKGLNDFAICFSFCCQIPLLLMFLICWVFFFVDVDNLFDTYPKFIQFILIVFKNFFVIIYFTQSSYFIKRIPIGFKKVVQFLFFCSIFSSNTFSVNSVFLLMDLSIPLVIHGFLIVSYVC